MNHKCGQCYKNFETEEAYLAHTCEVTGFTPTDPMHLGEDFALVQQAALERGEERQQEQ